MSTAIRVGHVIHIWDRVLTAAEVKAAHAFLKLYAVKLPVSLSHTTGVSLPPPNETYGLLIEACVKCSLAFKNQYQLQELLHTTDLSSEDLAAWAQRILGTDKEAIEALGKALLAVEEIG